MTVNELKAELDAWKDGEIEVFVHVAGGKHVPVKGVKLSRTGKGLDIVVASVLSDSTEEEDLYGEDDNIY